MNQHWWRGGVPLRGRDLDHRLQQASTVGDVAGSVEWPGGGPICTLWSTLAGEVPQRSLSQGLHLAQKCLQRRIGSVLGQQQAAKTGSGL